MGHSCLRSRLCAVQVKEFISSELLAQLCALGDCSELMDESPEQRQHRKQVLRKHAALKEALAVVSNISTSACSTARPAPVDSALMQAPRYRRLPVARFLIFFFFAGMPDRLHAVEAPVSASGPSLTILSLTQLLTPCKVNGQEQVCVLRPRPRRCKGDHCAQPGPTSRE